MLAGKAQGHDVGAGADDGAVAAKAGTEGERPPEGLEVVVPHGAHVLHHGYHGGDEGYVIDKGAHDGTKPEYAHGGGYGFAAGELHGLRGKPVDDAVHLKPADEYEEAHEEEDGGPFDFGKNVLEGFLAVGHGEQQQQGGSRHGDGAAFQPPVGDEAVAAEEAYGERKCEQTAHEQFLAADEALQLDVHDAVVVFADFGEFLAVDEQQDCHGEDEGNQAGECEVGDEGVEVQLLHLAGYHDVGRVTYHGAGAADVGGKDLRDDEWKGRYFEVLGEGEGDGDGEQDGGHVVEEGRAACHHDRQGDEQGYRVAVGFLRGPDGKESEEAGFAEHKHLYHHADEEGQGVEVDVLDGLLLGDDSRKHHNHGTEECYHGALHFFRYDQGVGDQKDDKCCCYVIGHGEKREVLFRRAIRRG